MRRAIPVKSGRRKPQRVKVSTAKAREFDAKQAREFADEALESAHYMMGCLSMGGFPQTYKPMFDAYLSRATFFTDRALGR